MENAAPAEYQIELEESVREAIHCATTLAQGGDADEAAEVLRNNCQKAPAVALMPVHSAIVEAYLRKECVEQALNFCLELLRKPADAARQLAPQAQDAVLRALAQAQQHGRALELLGAICNSGAAPPTDPVFNCVLDAAVRARAYGEAWDVLELLLKSQRRADKFFVSILTKSLEQKNLDRRWVRRGISLVDCFIDQQREDVDEIVFNSLLNVLGHVGDMQKLQHTLAKMEEYRVPPSAVTYGTVVKAYGRAHDIDAVLKVWNDMRRRCLGVNPVTCGCVLDACVKCGHLDKAMSIFQEMRVQGLHKNTVLYATLIKGLAKVRDLGGAIQLFREMRVEGVPCNLVTFNSLMDVCVRCGDLQAAAVFLQDMMSLGIEPDLITFSTLIKGYSQIGEVHKALALSRELQSRGLKCDEIMYNSLIDGCAKAAKVHEGLAVFDEMLRSHIIPSPITFSLLLKLYFEVGQVAEAFQLIDDMSNRFRCVPTKVVYTVLFRCCAQFGGDALVRAAATLLDLASRRNSRLPDQGMVSAVISGCAHHSDFETAANLGREFAVGGARRGTVVGVPMDCMKSLFQVLGSYDYARGKQLIEYLSSRAYPVSSLSQLQAALEDGSHKPGGVVAALDLSSTQLDDSMLGLTSPSEVSPTVSLHADASPYYPAAPAAPSHPPYGVDIYAEAAAAAQAQAAFDMAFGYYTSQIQQQQVLQQQVHQQMLLQQQQQILNPYAMPFAPPYFPPTAGMHGHVHGHVQAPPLGPFPPLPPMLPPGLVSSLATLPPGPSLVATMPALLPSVPPSAHLPTTGLPRQNPLSPLLASHAAPPTPTGASEVALATMSTTASSQAKTTMTATPLNTKSRSVSAGVGLPPSPNFSDMMTPPPRLAVDKGTANKENENPEGRRTKDIEENDALAKGGISQKGTRQIPGALEAVSRVL